MVGARSIPHGVKILLGEKFFDPCKIHESMKKNEKNIFCLSCCLTICQHCLPLHRSHRRLQIRRYVYQDVIRLSDAQRLINCSLVQPYTTNSAKVVFLNERPLSRPFRSSGNFCIKCDRSLQDPFLYCSISCKVKHIEADKHGGKELVQDSEFLPFFGKTRNNGDCSEEGSQITPDCVLKSLPLSWTCSGGSTNTSATSDVYSPVNEFLNKKTKKKRSCVLMSRISCRSRWLRSAASAVESNSRRKGVPHRSPLN